MLPCRSFTLNGNLLAERVRELWMLVHRHVKGLSMHAVGLCIRIVFLELLVDFLLLTNFVIVVLSEMSDILVEVFGHFWQQLLD